jgi:hypothetical protein
MARSGSFGTSVNPFGTGTFGGLAQYNIGDNLKDLEAYRLEIAWGNGDITDAEYAASLAALAAAADPNTQAQISAYNKLEDVQYRIARSEADAAGLDALIAFEQQSLAGMNPGNLRYRDVKSSLDALLANRRSRDYGVLVDAYNAGQTSTESLLEWVENTRASLPADAPDVDNWNSVHANLVERIVSEKDAQVYQDYQDKKMSGADFVAYLTGRRDAYSMDSPKWDEANRRLEDAVKNVKDTALAAQDQDVFNRYALGKISDATYLKYISKRIDGMDPSDPALPEWKQKLTQAAHSLAEDDLRHKVATATTVAGDATARKNLRDFYIAYAKTLNPGSAEYRQTEEQILSLKPAVAATGGGGGGGGGGKDPVVKGQPVKGDPKIPKIIPTTGSFDHILTLVTPNARAPKKDQAVAVAALRLNLASANDAKNDKVWLYYDPRYPGQTVTRRNPDGTIWKDENGKTEKIPGSSYRATSDQERAGLELATANYSYGLAGVAAQKGDVKGYWTALWHANEAFDRVRTIQATAVQRDITDKLKAIDDGIEVATKLNDPASVVALLRMKGEEIRGAMNDGTLDDAQREKWAEKGEALESNPLFPVWQTDMQGKPVYGADGKRIQTAGLVDIATGLLVAGTHFMLDTDAKGKPDWHYDWEDPQLGTWALNPDGSPSHVVVVTGAYGQRVVGEVKVGVAATLGIRVTDQNGVKHDIPYPERAQYFSYTDGYGNRVNGYSIDGGATWVQATGGVQPSLELNSPVTWTRNPDGSVTVTDGAGATLFASPNGLTGWQGGGDALAGAPISWFGQAAVESDGDTSAGVGAVGQRFRIVSAVDGVLNLVPREIIYAEVTAANVGAVAKRIVAAGSAAGASLAEESAAVRARGRVPTPTPLTGSDYVRQKRADAAVVAEREAAATARLALGDTLADEVADIEARKTPGAEWRAAGAFASALSNAVLPTVSGIISLGSAILNVVLPPRQLPPPYTPPSSLYAPVPTPTLRTVTPVAPISRVTSPTGVTKTVSTGKTPTPVGKPALYETNPKPVAPKPVAPKPVVKLAPPTYKPRAT